MPILLDLTGQKINKWLVLKEDKPYHSPSGRTERMWLCQCECGTIRPVRQSNLRSGTTHDCGCSRQKTNSKFRTKKSGCDLTHQQFGALYVLEDDGTRNNWGQIKWKCQCECGTITHVLTRDLKQNKVMSCGCKNSKGELKLILALTELNIPYSTQQTFETCRLPSGGLAKFDFYINNQILIEYDGIQHYTYTSGWNTEDALKLRQQADQYKNQWCKDNNIPLIRISYTDFNKINTNYVKQLLQPYMEEA